MKGLVAEGRLELMQVYKLLQCVRNRDKAQIEKMARLGVPNLINLSEPQEGLSSLHQAAEANDGNMINFLLAQGALPDLQDKAGCTPAMRAAKLGHYGIIELLGSKGADMKAVDLEGRGTVTVRVLQCVHMLNKVLTR
ncbi:ankyrin repeat and EF-hand domain-containing protein 1-like [Anguilla rostrata]|uniref:ankyrin repeat and EF-hand domain-containing protein 1-like n=1 Tax=Anguilla rostrata TaxID=7938 RepID=UPI0030CC0689